MCSSVGSDRDGNVDADTDRDEAGVVEWIEDVTVVRVEECDV